MAVSSGLGLLGAAFRSCWVQIQLQQMSRLEAVICWPGSVFTGCHGPEVLRFVDNCKDH